MNDKAFLTKYGLYYNFEDSFPEVYKFLPIIGFSKPSKGESNIIKLFLSPIIFYISTTVLKDHFARKVAKENPNVPKKRRFCFCIKFNDDREDEKKAEQNKEHLLD